MIDSHQHFWKYDPVAYAWINDEMSVLKRDFLPSDLEPLLRAQKISGSIAVQAAHSEEETRFLLDLAAQFDFIKGVVGWTDLRKHALPSAFEKLGEEKKLKGIRHVLQAEPPGFMTDAKFIDGVNLLSRYDLTYDLLVYHHQLAEAVDFLARTTNVKIVIDHIAKPAIGSAEVQPWKRLMAQAASYENVFCKISGMVTEADWQNWSASDFRPYLDTVFECFDTDRILYGSDWPVCLLAATYDEQLSVVESYMNALSADEKERVMGKNAERFYNI